MKGSSFGDNIYKEIQYGNNLYNDKKEMANLFNKYYVDSIKSFREEDYKIDLIREVKYTDCVLEVFSKIEITELNRIVQNLTNKNGTEEEINVEIMKILTAVAGGKICKILNRSLEEGIFPDKWKKAIVIPVPKVRRTIKIEEFRPINKLPIYEKILEIIVHKQLGEYLENNKLIEECQSGFRSKHSCETALQWVISSWKRTISEGKMIGVVFLDLRKAFEVVDRSILLKKLEGYGLKETVLKWFNSYLDNRTQRVKFNGKISDPIDVELGVPQVFWGCYYSCFT
ncbi:rna-directed dna polymerase from mobile element jockey-like protein [Lasius niger]|uniref:Rna-directed dna polymerase from mobile element jockey-like protein n=1 Tax=Lasius niger TaxID=67767 RepID=A0A0J7KM31_LASNI|nr:rna-directed dna polymerase from mobile element jockey-like protein [Lasius niger]